MSDTPKDPSTETGETPEGQEGTGQPDRGHDESGTDGGDRDGSDENEGEEGAPTAEAYKKLQAKAERRERALRKAQDELAAIRKEKDGEGEEDPEVRANQKLIRASAKAVLAGAGVTDRAAQSEVLELINLADIEVDASGDPDEDEISERIERLRKALGAGPAKPAKRTPAGRSATDRGGSSEGSLTPDQKRYRAFLNS